MNKVIKSLKHLFVPHEHNNYKPHILREASVIFISVLAIVLLSISAGTISYIKKNNLTATVLPAVILDLTNSARISNSQKVLTRNPTLDKVAKRLPLIFGRLIMIPKIGFQAVRVLKILESLL
jgi:hypothetical protein